MKTIVIFGRHDGPEISLFLQAILPKLKIKFKELMLEIFFENDFKKEKASELYSNMLKATADIETELSLLKSQRADPLLIERIAYIIMCHQQLMEVADLAQKFSPDATIAGVDHYQYRELSTQFTALFSGVAPLRDEVIAKKILKEQLKTISGPVLRIVLLGPMHYGVMYELLLQSNISFIEKHFGFIYLDFPESQLSTFREFYERQISKQPMSFFPFKTKIIRWPTDATNEFLYACFQEVLSSEAYFLGQTSEKFLQDIKKNIIKRKEDAQVVELTLKRGQLILDAIELKLPNLSHIEHQHIFNFITSTLWNQLDIRLWNKSTQVFSSGSEKKFSGKEINSLMTSIIRLSKERGLFDSIKQGEFTEEADIEVLIIPCKIQDSYSAVSNLETASVQKTQRSCRFFPIAAAVVSLAALIVITISMSDLEKFSPRFEL